MQYKTPYADLLPPLTDDEYATLKNDIASRGILIPVIFDELCNVIDGHHRLRIAGELSLTDYPVEIRYGLSDDEKEQLAWDLNAHRRHMTKEMRQEWAQKLRSKGLSYRAIARQLGVDHTTVMSDVASGGGFPPPENQSGEKPATIEGIDGKRYASIRVKPSDIIKTAALVNEGPVADLAKQLRVDNAEKLAILDRLHKSAGSPESNGTFTEIADTGGFAWGNEMEKWCNFGQATIEEISKGLKSISDHHKHVHISENSGNQEWYTPSKIIDAVVDVLGDIDLDPASCQAANRTVGAKKYYTIADDGLSQEWAGRVYLNPPYARGVIELFVDKLVSSPLVSSAVVLTNNATETAWGQKLLRAASAVCFISGRVGFWGTDRETSDPLQGQMVTYIGTNVSRFEDVFANMGVIWTK